MERFTRFVVAHRRVVICTWIALAAFGAFAASQVADRFSQDFSIPGYSGYEANKRVFETVALLLLPPARERGRLS